jgi:hypothetical protein
VGDMDYSLMDNDPMPLVSCCVFKYASNWFERIGLQFGVGTLQVKKPTNVERYNLCACASTSGAMFSSLTGNLIDVRKCSKAENRNQLKSLSLL